MSLSGRFRYRKSLMGSIVLQLEHEFRIPWPLPRRGQFRQSWRDARMSDLLKPELRGLLEVREFIQQFPEANYSGLRSPVMRIFGPESNKLKVVGSEADKANNPSPQADREREYLPKAPTFS